MFVCLISEFSHAAVQRYSIVLSDGKLSASLKQAPFNDIVTFVSEKAGIQIYIFNDTDKKTLTVEFSDRSLESGLRSILKNVNYAIVYNNGLERGDRKSTRLNSSHRS